MKIVFMGTPDFAVPSLEALIDKFGVEAVFGARSDARHSAGIIDHKGIHFRAVHDRDILHAFERFEHRQDIAGTVACR